MNAATVSWNDFYQWARAAGFSGRLLSRWDADCLALQDLFLAQISRRVH